MQVNKKYLKSKTLWMALIVAILPVFPDAQEIIKEHTDVFLYAISGLFAGLRMVTKDPIWGNEEQREIE